MGTPFIAEVKIIGFNFPPKGWAFCNGQLLPIAQNQALYSLLGTTYGGDGVTTFGLPNLQGRTPIHWGNGQGLPPAKLGQVGGEASHTLTIGEMPGHMHIANATNDDASDKGAPANALLAVGSGLSPYNQNAANTPLANGTVGNLAGDQPHNNLQPYQVVNFAIALTGIYPTRS